MDKDEQGFVIIAVTIVIVLGALVAAILVRDSRSDAPEPSTTQVQVPDPLGRCDSLAGLPTDKVVSVGLCTNATGGQTVLISASRDCGKGRLLYWNDTGWGYKGGTWQAGQRTRC